MSRLDTAPLAQGVERTDADPTAGLVVVALLVITAAVSASLRVVGPGERLVVLRLGRVRRVHGPGLALLVPALDKAVRVDVAETRLDPLVAQATTRDGMLVRVRAAARIRIVEPTRYATDGGDAAARTAEAIESVIRQTVEEGDLHRLADRRGWDTRLRERASGLAAAHGCDISELETVDVTLSVNRSLLGWAGRSAAHAGRT